MVILDIETVPDGLDVLVKNKRYLSDKGDSLLDRLEQRFKNLQDAKDWNKAHAALIDVHEAIIKKASLDPMLARVACIGIIHKDKKTRVSRVFFDRDSEENLLNSFWDYVREKNIECKTITFNGLNFDLPFLYFRSMKYGIEIPWHDVSLRRFTSFPHFDIMQQMSFWNNSSYKGLSYIARFFGYDCDPENELNGSSVFKLWCLGMDARLQDYNLEDCNKTAFIYNKVHKYYPQAPKPMAEKK